MHENGNDELPRSLTHCSNCQKSYKSTDPNGIFVPLILQCAHNCCESCIREFIENEGFVLCKKCGMKSVPKSPVGRMYHNLRENFPLAEQIMNQLDEYEKRKYGVDESQIGFAAASTSFPIPEKSLIVFCDECGIYFPDCKCQECESLLCSSCFQRIHGSKTLKNHHQIPLGNSNNLTQLVNSNEENNLNNAEALSKAKEMYEKSLKKLTKVEFSLKLLMDENFLKEANKSSLNHRELFQNLTDYFNIALHTLNLKYQTTMVEFHRVENSLENSAKTCGKNLETLRMHLKSMTNELHSVLKNNQPIENVEKLIENCEMVLNQPDTVYTTGYTPPEKPRGSYPAKPLLEYAIAAIINCIDRIRYSERWLKLMEEECVFDFGKGSEFCLVPSLDSRLPSVDNQDFQSPNERSTDSISNLEVTSAQSYEFIRSETSDESNFAGTHKNNIDKLSCKSQPYTRILQRRQSNTSAGSSNRDDASITSAMNSSTRPRSVVNSYIDDFTNKFVPKSKSGPTGPSYSECGFKHTLGSKKETSLRTRKSDQLTLRSGNTLKDVRISHIENPSHFYVQKKDAKKGLAKYKKMFAQAIKFSTISFGEINKGIMYLALCSDNSWYRVRVIETSANSEDLNLSLITVMQVDIGKEEQVYLSNMRQIDKLLRPVQLEEDLAINCCLFECFPVDKAKWSQADIEEFKKILMNGNKIDMYIHKVQPWRLEVDLSYFKENSPINVRDFFVYSDRARFCSINDSVVPLVRKDYKLYWDRDFESGNWVLIKVMYIENPHEFYVKRDGSHHCTSFSQLTNRMTEYFKVKSHYLVHAVQNPTVGLAVAAQYRTDNKWYRALIISIRNGNRIFVRYVDFGNTEWLPMSRIRSLSEDFTHITVQAIKCSLNDVLPTKKQWSIDEIEFFKKRAVGKPLQIVVQGQKDDTLLVSLFESTDNDEVKCINEELVEYGYAKGCGANASIKPLANGKSQKESSIRNEASEKKVASISEDTSSDIEDEEGVRRSECSSKKEGDSLPSSEKYLVNVCNFINPNLLYVSFMDHRAGIVRLMSNMAHFYRDEKNNKENILQSVMEEMKCAVYVENDKKWYRGKVLNIIDGQIVRVFLSDVAIVEVVSLANLRKLPIEFMKEMDGVIRCSLAGVETKEEWPTDICEKLKTQLKDYKEIYIVRKDRTDNSLIVELWGKNIICTGPLDPQIDKWTCINKLITDSFEIESENENRDKFEEYKPPSEKNVKKLEKVSGVRNSTEHVAEWLNSSITESRIKGIEYSSLIEARSPNGQASSDTTIDENETDLIESISTIGEIDDWISPEPLEKTEFVGMPTYVDSDFNVYVQISGQYNGVLDIISNGLDSRYQNSQPLPSDMHWQPGQICVAWFFLDKKWYRGRVKEVNKTIGKVLVEYVDYGNIEWLDPSNLRKNVALKHIPVQCYKIPIRSDCVSSSGDGLWPISVLEFVHLTVVEKICEIQLRKEENEHFYRIEQLIIPQKLDLFDLLYQLNHAVCTSTTKENKSFPNKAKKWRKGTVVSSIADVKEDEDVDTLDNKDAIDAHDKEDKVIDDHDDDDNDDGDNTSSSSVSAIETIGNIKINVLDDLKAMQMNMLNIVNPSIVTQVAEDELIISYYYIHEDMGIVNVEVTEILSLNEIVVHVLSSETDLSISENRKLFLELSTELQTEAIKQPCLKPPYTGRMCCTKFEDGNWYRAQIIGKITNNFIKVPVYYIDYGNVSTMEVSQLHELKPAWYHIPIQGVKCTLEGVQLPEKVSLVEKLGKKISKKLLNKEFKALIRPASSKENQYYIKIMDDDNNVPYQSIIDGKYS